MRINSIIEKNEKRINIGMYIQDELKEKDSEGNNKEDYVTIKKIPYTVKKKIEFLSMNSLSGHAGKAMFKYMKTKGISNLDGLSNSEKAEIMMDMKLSNDDMNEISKMTNETVKNYIDNGIDSLKHSFVDENDKPIDLNYSIIEKLGNDKLIDYLVNEIKNYSDGYVLGE